MSPLHLKLVSFLHRFLLFFIISDVTAMNLRCCLWKTTYSSDEESTVLRFTTANKASVSCITDKLALWLINVNIRWKLDMVTKVADVRRIRILWRQLFSAVIRGNRCLAGQLSWILFKVLLYDDLVGVVTWQRWHYSIRHGRNPIIRKLHGSVFYTSEVIAD